MSHDAMYDALASAALKRCKTEGRTWCILREFQAMAPVSQENAAGLAFVICELKKKLESFTPPEPERERFP